MYEHFKNIILDLMKAPKGAPPAPAGTHDSIQIFRASPQFLRYQMLVLSIVMGVIAILFIILSILVLISNFGIGLIVGVLLFLLFGMLCGIAYILVRLEYELRFYIVTDRSLRIRRGVWSIVEQTLTYANVQNVKVEQGPLERVFGVANLAVETAGGGAAMAGPEQSGFSSANYHRAVLRGLDNAEMVRDIILGYLRQLPHTVAGLGDPDERRKTRKSLSPGELDVLKEILAEASHLRQALTASSE